MSENQESSIHILNMSKLEFINKLKNEYDAMAPKEKLVSQIHMGQNALSTLVENGVSDPVEDVISQLNNSIPGKEQKILKKILKEDYGIDVQFEIDTRAACSHQVFYNFLTGFCSRKNEKAHVQENKVYDDRETGRSIHKYLEYNFETLKGFVHFKAKSKGIYFATEFNLKVSQDGTLKALIEDAPDELSIDIMSLNTWYKEFLKEQNNKIGGLQ